MKQSFVYIAAVAVALSACASAPDQNTGGTGTNTGGTGTGGSGTGGTGTGGTGTGSTGSGGTGTGGTGTGTGTGGTGSGSGGGATTTPPPPPPTSVIVNAASEQVGIGTTNLVMMVTPGKTVLGLGNDNGAIDIPFDGAFFGNGFDGYFDSATAKHIGHARKTISGEGYVIVAVSKTDGLSILAHEFGRTGTSDVPLTGTASFTGDYVGYQANLFNYNPNYLIVGDVSLDADLEAGTIHGLVNNRGNLFGGGLTFQDITLDSATIADGAFSGAASGGQVTMAAYTGSGTWSGMFTGANGQEVVGGVELTFSGSGSSDAETGVFIAE